MNTSRLRKAIALTVLAFVCAAVFAGQTRPQQNTPEPQLFAPGVVSTGHEFALTFTKDMKEAYFSRNFPERKANSIMRTEFRNGAWQKAVPVSFSEDHYSDLDPALSPNGRRLFFVATRPVTGADPKTRNMDIWYSDRAANRTRNDAADWGAPQHLENVNSAGKEGSPTVAKDGTLCFFSDRGRGPNLNSIYCAEWQGNKYGEPIKMGPEINSEASDTSPAFSGDGNTIVFYSNRPGGYGKGDLYVSFRRNHKWTQATNLGAVVNTAESEYNPVLSPDGKTLYFGRNGNIYWIPIEALKISGLDVKHLRR
jgi:Tol biopolymer transport system component